MLRMFSFSDNVKNVQWIKGEIGFLIKGMALLSHYNQVWSTFSPTDFEDLLVCMKHTLQSHEMQGMF
jgi:hypothetical protein